MTESHCVLCESREETLVPIHRERVERVCQVCRSFILLSWWAWTEDERYLDLFRHDLSGPIRRTLKEKKS